MDFHFGKKKVSEKDEHITHAFVNGKVYFSALDIIAFFEARENDINSREVDKDAARVTKNFFIRANMDVLQTHMTAGQQPQEKK